MLKSNPLVIHQLRGVAGKKRFYLKRRWCFCKYHMQFLTLNVLADSGSKSAQARKREFILNTFSRKKFKNAKVVVFSLFQLICQGKGNFVCLKQCKNSIFKNVRGCKKRLWPENTLLGFFLLYWCEFLNVIHMEKISFLDEHNFIFSSTEPVSALCGISRVWVLSNNRRQKIATRLVDCLRYIYWFEL